MSVDPIKKAKLYDHQVEALSKMKNGCILKGGVGTGKSLTATVYYMLNEAPKDVYIITTAKKRDSLDWEADMIKFGIVGAETSLQGFLTVDSWNNIGKYTDVGGAFFIFDEQRLVGSGAWVKAFYKIAAKNSWIMLSATPGDTWLEYIPVFVANGYYKNKTEFIRNHVVYNSYSRYPKVDRYVGVTRLAKLRRAIIVDMPYLRHTTRHDVVIRTEYDKDKWKTLIKDRWNPYEQRPIKDVSELFRLMRFLVNTDPSKLVRLTEIHDKHPRLIIFYNFNYELEMLRQWGATRGVETAEWNGHKHETLPEGDAWLYFVQYTAGAEGWNCITTDSVVLLSQNYSYKITEQAKGRIDRLNTPFTNLYYYVLRSGAGIDNAIHMALVKKQDFNESAAHKSSWLKGE